MKKIVISLMLLLVLGILVFGGLLGYSYIQIEESSLPQIELMADGKRLSPKEYEWSVPVMGGILQKEFKNIIDGISEPVLSNGEPPPLSLNPANAAQIQIIRAGKELFNGSLEKYNTFRFDENGEYEVMVTVREEGSPDTPTGKTVFSFLCMVTLPPKLSVSSDEVKQGDVVALLMEGVSEGDIPTAQTELGMSVFMKYSKDTYMAFVPASYSKNPGEYEIEVTCGGFYEKVSVKLVEGDFERQDLWIDTSNPVISEANSPEAYQQVRSSIYPFYETADERIYWIGQFVKPVDGRITTQYGLKRYTNGSKTPSRHAGVDLAAPIGTPVAAPAAGRVVFAQYLLNTGNTLVIEHGGGLKTYYFHMNKLLVEADDMVTGGQQVGEVGTTGYSTGPHLHFEMRIGNQSISPWNLIEKTGGFFAFENTPDQMCWR